MRIIPSAHGFPDLYKGVNCKLLIHSDTTDGSTTFTDSSTIGHTVTESAGDGSVQHDTAQKKFGKTSMLFDGTDGILSIADHAGFDVGANPFTIDQWLRWATLPGGPNLGQTIFKRQVDASNYCHLTISLASGSTFDFEFVWHGGGSDDVNLAFTGTLLVDTWYHVAVIRGWGGNADDYMITLDGQALGSATTDASTLTDFAAAVELGDVQAEQYFGGWMDEFRWVTGSAIWTANFTPPFRPYI